MHIPDGFLDAKTLAVTAVLSIAGLGLALRRAGRGPAARRAPLIGLTAAFVFASQMINFPVAAGTSGHLVGAVLAAVLVGPEAAVVVMVSVLVLQCFMFNDGGVLALGANAFNMAVVAPTAGWLVYRGVRRVAGGGLRGTLLAATFAAWCSVVAASLACAGELAWSGTVAAKLVLPAMGGIHMIIGLGEAAITALVLAAVARARPELLAEQPGATPVPRGFLAQGLVATLGLALFLSPFASGLPDGLEKVAQKLGFEARAASGPWAAPLPDYAVPGLGSAVAGTALAGLAGTVLVFALSWLLSWALTRKTPMPRKT